MQTLVARAWSADWFPAYLAAIGVASLVEGATLAWTDDVVPAARFMMPGGTPADVVASALPRVADIERLTIARRHPDSPGEFPRGVSSATFRERARLARSTGDGSLEATVTDLSTEAGKDLDHGPLDPPAPKGLTLHDRLLSTRSLLPDPVPPAMVADSMAGCARRVEGNGLGFDIRRLDAAVQADAKRWVDPLVELLAFYGLIRFPVRGSPGRARQRGWAKRSLARGSLSWPAWSQPLDQWGIDALLDRFYALVPAAATVPTRPEEATRLSIHAAFASVSRQPRGSLDVTRGLGSERVW